MKIFRKLKGLDEPEEEQSAEEEDLFQEED